MLHRDHGLDTTAGSKVEFRISINILSFFSLVTSDTEDFEDYIMRNSPAIISNNTAENPTVGSSDRDTYKEECEFKTGMSNWNKNFARCPSGLFDP